MKPVLKLEAPARDPSIGFVFPDDDDEEEDDDEDEDEDVVDGGGGGGGETSSLSSSGEGREGDVGAEVPSSREEVSTDSATPRTGSGEDPR